MLAYASVALAGPSALTYKGCIANEGANGCREAKHKSLAYLAQAAASPDGDSVYAVGVQGITAFDRGPRGALSFRGCIAQAAHDGCREPEHGSLLGSFDVVVSPDGKSVYVASYLGRAITRFARSQSGKLTYKGCFANRGRGGCRRPEHDSLGLPTGIAVSPDGRSLYVADYAGNSVTRFKRGPHGALTYRGCFANGGAHGCRHPRHDSLEDAAAVAVSPDGESVYVGGEDGITRFKRGQGGGLTYGGCIADHGDEGCRRPRHASVGDSYGLAVSPDGKSVYSAAYGHDAVNRFDRPSNGALRYRGCFANTRELGCRKANHESLRGAARVAISHDGRSLYVVSVGGNSVTAFSRGRKGGLDYAGCVANRSANGCKRAAHSSLRAPEGVAISPDDSSLYVASAGSDSITFLRRGPSP